MAATTMALSLGCVAGGVAPAAPAARVGPGEAFSLRVGESTAAGDSALRVGFEGVSVDSRCPKGEQCVWSGDATVRVWVQIGAGPRQARELHTATTGAVRNADRRDPVVQLLRLDPVPVSGRTIAQRDYLATLSIADDTAANPER